MFVQTEFTKSNNNNPTSSTLNTQSEDLIKDLDLISRFCMPICSRDNEIREVALDVISKTVEGWLDGVGSPKHYRPSRNVERKKVMVGQNCGCNNGGIVDVPREYLDLVALHLPIILRLSVCCPFVNVREKCQHILEIVQSRGLPIPYPVIYGPSAYIDADEINLQMKQSNLDDLIVDWMAKKHLPLCFFDDEETQQLFRFFNKDLEVPKRTALKNKVIARFEKMQNVVLSILKTNQSKIAFTIDGWTSIGNKSFYGITAHFLDNEWKLQSLVLDFVASRGKHTGKDIAEIFFNCVKKFQIENKVSGITVDNASANTTFMLELSYLMRNNGITSFSAEDTHFRCYAHIINIAVQEMLKHLNVVDIGNFREEESDTEEEDDEEEVPSNALKKIRGLFKKIKKSEQWTNKFRSCCDTANVNYLTLNIDVSTRWNSTHDMLKTALKLKAAIQLLCENNINLKDYVLSEYDWEVFDHLHSFLKNFKTLSVILSGDKYVTLPLVIIGFNLLLDKVELEISKFNKINNRSAAENALLAAYTAAKSKLIKHYAKSNWIYCIVLLLDPRHKKETFLLTHWGREMQEKSMEKFENVFKNNYFVEQEEISSSSEEDDTLDVTSLFSKPQKQGSCREELERYFNSGRETKNVEILNWWRENEKLYPTLAKMAKDYLAIPATSVPAERLFSRAGLTIRRHRNRLNEESARYLLCLNSWCTSNLKNIILEKLNDTNLQDSVIK